MQKKNFVSLILGTIGGILFAIGMCMCLLPEWGAFTQGVVIAVIGAVVLLILLLVRRKMEGKPAIHLSGKAVGSVLLGVVGALALGIGMCMVIQRIDTVDGALQLAGKTMVINRGSQHDHLRRIQQRVNFLHIILLNTLPLMAGIFFVAVFAGQAPSDFLLADIHHVYLMAVFLGAFCKGLHHSGCVPVWPGAAV